MQKPIRATIMRGGTSRAIFFHERDLPLDSRVRDRVIASAFGSPDPFGRQINGLGGATSTTSKVAIISPSSRSLLDVDYTFGQVDICTGAIEYKGNCGNISSAVGPFAIDEGLVEAKDHETIVRILNTNTKKVIEAAVPTVGRKAAVEGGYAIHGVPGTGAEIKLSFQEPGGSVTGKLLPTGQPSTKLTVPGHGKFEVSIVDAANPVVFVLAEQLGLSGVELPEQIAAGEDRLATLEAIRTTAASQIGITSSRAIPKIAFVAPPTAYTTTGNDKVAAVEMSFCARTLSMGTPHPAYALTGAICTAIAACIRGSVVNQVTAQAPFTGESVVQIRIGHPAGILDVGVEVLMCDDGTWHARRALVSRTARRLMEGFVLVPETLFELTDSEELEKETIP